MHSDEHAAIAPLLPPPFADRFIRPIATALMQRRTQYDAALVELADTQAMTLARVATAMIATLRHSNKILVAGNGGSASEAQHFTAGLVGRFKRERVPFAVLSLTTDTATLTAIANDYGFHHVFARQVLALGNAGDLFLAFSTSGESENIICAAQAAQRRDLAVIAITGAHSSRLSHLATETIHVPFTDTALIQEMHMLITHILCDIIETELAGQE